MRKLLLRTYCWGIVPIALVAVAVSDGDLLNTRGCALKKSVAPPQTYSTAAMESEPSCCSLADHDLRAAKLRVQPTLVSSPSRADIANDRVCVYGTNFGNTRGASILAFGGVGASSYDRWIDPGAPYGPGHYAEACVRVSRETPSGEVGVQLTTPYGASNRLAFRMDQPLRTSHVQMASAVSPAFMR